MVMSLCWWEYEYRSKTRFATSSQKDAWPFSSFRLTHELLFLGNRSHKKVLNMFYYEAQTAYITAVCCGN